METLIVPFVHSKGNGIADLRQEEVKLIFFDDPKINEYLGLLATGNTQKDENHEKHIDHIKNNDAHENFINYIKDYIKICKNNKWH